MKLNQLNSDGLIAWLQLAYGPCYNIVCCTTTRKQELILCDRHLTYDCITCLLDNKITIHLDYALQDAAYIGDFHVTKLLLDVGADPSESDHEALYWAKAHNDSDIIKLLQSVKEK